MDLQAIKRRYNIIGNSPALNYAIDRAARVAPTELTVLIHGESGVGKEAFSKIIHGLSTRKHEPIIAINCGAIPEGTIDSELFGHEKGAFTGAHETRKGYFETVNNGTIFLDEIGEMPLGTQARLLRILESGEFIKVGSSKVQKTNVRVIGATNVELGKAVQEGRFREDLFYRLNTVPLVIPSLRERGTDIVLLFMKFASDFAERYRTPTLELTPDAQEVLTSYRFPGNVRELKNITEQISVLQEHQLVDADTLKSFLPSYQDGWTSLPAIRKQPVGEQNSEPLSYTEREIMYKFLFDMKKDLNDLKSFVLNMATNSGYVGSTEEGNEHLSDHSNTDKSKLPSAIQKEFEQIEDHQSQAAQIIYKSDTSPHHHEEEIEEVSLNLADHEKSIIVKALKKHKGKRKDAADDLGISERTLYRKIKEYDLDY